jgi:hypothetical protein
MMMAVIPGFLLKRVRKNTMNKITDSHYIEIVEISEHQA